MSQFSINMHYKVYNELAWTDKCIASPEEYRTETEFFVRLIRDTASIEPKTLLHLGCGAGLNDYIFKEHFMVTGVDISRSMLDLAAELNPEAAYMLGDMRDLRLIRHFDAVVIPDSIGYMTDTDDLRAAVQTARRHLIRGGGLLIAALVEEDFRENNFVYTGSKENVEVTLFENNHRDPANPLVYEATMVFLIRRGADLEIHIDCHRCGLFSFETLLSILRDSGFEVQCSKLEHAYDRFMPEGGQYVQRIFSCRKL